MPSERRLQSSRDYKAATTREATAATGTSHVGKASRLARSKCSARSKACNPRPDHERPRRLVFAQTRRDPRLLITPLPDTRGTTHPRPIGHGLRYTLISLHTPVGTFQRNCFLTLTIYLPVTARPILLSQGQGQVHDNRVCKLSLRRGLSRVAHDVGGAPHKVRPTCRDYQAILIDFCIRSESCVVLSVLFGYTVVCVHLGVGTEAWLACSRGSGSYSRYGVYNSSTAMMSPAGS